MVAITNVSFGTYVTTSTYLIADVTVSTVKVTLGYLNRSPNLSTLLSLAITGTR
jgi:hypothetical protein